MTGASVQDSIEAVVDSLLAREDALVATMLARNAEEASEFGDLADDSETLEAVRESARSNLREALTSLRRDRQAPDRLPTGALEEARATARAGISIDSLLHTYRIGHAVVWEAIIDEVEGLELEREARRDVLRTIARYAFAYIDAVIPLVRDAYEEERRRLLNRRQQRRIQLVRDLLDGGTAAAGELGYPLELTHTALVVTGHEHSDLVASLAGVHGSRVLAIEVSPSTSWAWLGKRIWEDDELEVLAEHRVENGSLALGEPGPGPAGFRSSHRQALRARLVGQLLRQPVTRFRSIAFDALALEDEPAARSFVEGELCRLGGIKNAETLKETLRAYFAVGLNAAAAAALLGVHERTIGYRLRIVEETIGQTLNERRLELEAALRLEALLQVPQKSDV
jgi:hypothetical protein